MMQNFKMIATDLDRTLLRNDKTISKYTREIFRMCKLKGIKIVFVSARPLRRVEEYFSSIEPDATICHNGALIIFHGEEKKKSGILQEDVKTILSNLFSIYPKCEIAVENEECLYANYNAGEELDEIHFIFTDFQDLPQGESEKILIPSIENYDLDSIKSCIPKNYYLEISENVLGMILNKKATKWAALQEVTKKYGIEIQDVVAFGDDRNDLDMLKQCGRGIAVSNAEKEILENVNEICESNEEDGVARWVFKNMIR